MSIEEKEVDKIEEKSSENNSNSEYKHLESNKNENNNNNKGKSYKIPILSNYNINMIGNKYFKGSKKSVKRFSCQPVLSLLKRQNSSCSIRQSKTRKRTAGAFRNYSTKLFSPIFQLKPSIPENNQYINKKVNNITSNNSERKENIKVLSGKLNIYERAKKNLERRNNYIKKKQDLQIQEINNNRKIQFMGKISQDIMDRKSEYIPIQYRAIDLHNKHIFETLIHENYIKLKQVEEENKECQIVYQHTNKKTFDEDNWEDFLNSQECWQREKQFKQKAAELLRYTIEKDNSIPKINKKSELIINNIRKKLLNIDDIHTRLYKDFDNLQERKKLRMCNTMPSFKPLINKCIKIGHPKDLNINNSSSIKFCKIFDRILKQKLNRNIKKYNKQNTTIKSYINKNGLNNIHSNYIYNSKVLSWNYKLRNNKTKIERNKYFEEKNIFPKNCEDNIQINKSQNISNKYIFYNNKSKQVNNVKNNKFFKSGSYMNKHNNKIKQNTFFNKSNNSDLYSRIKKQKH